MLHLFHVRILGPPGDTRESLQWGQILGSLSGPWILVQQLLKLSSLGTGGGGRGAVEQVKMRTLKVKFIYPHCLN